MLHAAIKHSFEVRTRAGFTGVVGGRMQGATLIMVNDRAIPCSAPGFGDKDMVVATMALVAPHTDGIARAPFKYNDKSAAKAPTKPLTAFDADGNMQFWSYVKKGTDKGERQEDATWRMRAGTTYKFFFRRDDIEKKGDRVALAMPANIDEIPPFTLCEVVVVPKSTGPCSEGWGLTVKSVRVSPLSLYSYAARLAAFPGSREEAKHAMLVEADQEQCVRRHIENENPCFVPTSVGADAFTTVDDELRVVKLRNYSNAPTDIDFEFAAVMRYTNTSSVESACRLLEVAIALRALRVFVFTSTWRAKKAGLSECFGVPVLDTEKLLAAAVAPDAPVGDGDDDEAAVAFVARESAPMFAPDARLLLGVGAELVEPKTRGAPTPDLVLVDDSACCERAFPVEFRLDGGGTGTVLWRGAFNTTPANMECAAGGGGALPQRRKWGSMASV